MSLESVTRTASARIPTQEAEFQLCHYANSVDAKEHLALTLGDVLGGDDLLVRVHSECFTGDVLGSTRCDCGEQLHNAMRLISQAGRGVVIYLRQEGRGIGLAKKLQAYNLQDQGYDTVDANLLLGHEADEREYWAAAAILRDLGVRSISLLTNNPQKIDCLRELGVDVTQRVALETAVTTENAGYLATKVERMHHLLNLSISSNGSGGYRHLAPHLQQHVDQLALESRAFAGSHPRPFVTLSYAQSLDGSIAAAPGRQELISSPESMVMTHALRAAHDAILVGIGTVLSDDPRLTVRLVQGDSPRPVVLDSRLRLPLNARLLQAPRTPWIATASADRARRADVEEAGAETLTVPLDPSGRLDLADLLKTLHARGVRNLMVEGGSQVIGSFLRQHLVDSLVLTVAPRFLAGPGAALAQPHHRSEGQLPTLVEPTYHQVGPDLVVIGRPVWQSEITPSPASK